MRIEPLYREIGLRIAHARGRAGTTQQHLANAVGLTRTSVANIEAGRQRVMVHQLVAMASALGVRVCNIIPGSAE